MIQIYLLKIILIIWLYAETKDFRDEFRASRHNGAVRQAFCEPYRFVPPCSVGALVTLPHVGTVRYNFIKILENFPMSEWPF